MRDTWIMFEPVAPAPSSRTRGRFMVLAGVVGAVAMIGASTAAATQITALLIGASRTPPAVTVDAAPPPPPARVAVKEPAIRPVDFTLVAAGDVLPHGPVVDS